MHKLAETYTKSKDYSKDIMNEIKDHLTENSIAFNEKSYGNEIVINDKDQSKKSITDIIMTSIPSDVFKLLVEIVEVEDCVYIRQKTK